MKNVYLGGDIMTRGSNLARQEEYDKFMAMGIDGLNVYSPVLNKSINDKTSVTEEENNHLAEKITKADIERLWNADTVAMCVEQSAIGSLCEIGCLFGWQWMSNKLLDLIIIGGSENKSAEEILQSVIEEIDRISEKKSYFHSYDIRNTQLNEKGWRRSHSINQLLYGMILATSETGDLELSFDDVVKAIKEKSDADNYEDMEWYR